MSDQPNLSPRESARASNRLASPRVEGGQPLHLLVRRAAAEGIDPYSLFSGPSHIAYARASEDLKRWWADNPRTTLAEHPERITGTRSEAADAARKSRTDRDNRL
ncbi:hypothetical protein ACH4Q6_35700 [Streptomyces lydicus]|uniref:hypothetical protein n=1 Tax=Streptomyces lydicus TaxID=47763 RepID=UPI0037880D88